MLLRNTATVKYRAAPTPKDISRRGAKCVVNSNIPKLASCHQQLALPSGIAHPVKGAVHGTATAGRGVVTGAGQAGRGIARGTVVAARGVGRGAVCLFTLGTRCR